MQTPEVKVIDQKIGNGTEASKGALVQIHYQGLLEDGTEFDSTQKHGRPFQFVVGSKKIIQGMSLGILGMKVGGLRSLFIPAELAYQERQMGPFIKPHSNLIFHIELIEALPRE